MTHKMESCASYQSFLKSPHKSIKYTTYFQVYDELFSRYREKKITFVEIGILDGGSLFMWRDFFGEDARIIGIDLNPAARKWESEGFEIHIGSQSDPKFWETFFDAVGNVDIVLDDGGHTFEQQIITTEYCIPFINDGGTMVVEDTHTSYMPMFGGPSKISFMNYAKNIVDGINYRFSDFANTKKNERNIFSVRFFESLVAFDIRRQHCGVPSEPIDNGREAMGATDFRYSGDKNLSGLLFLGSKLRSLKKVPVVGERAKAFFYFLIGRFTNIGKTRNLKKHFRF